MEKTANLIACDMIMHPEEERYVNVHLRQFQGCPTLAVTPGGRIYMGWYAGGTCEPHMENFNLLVCSDDQGKTWSKPLMVIPSSKERCVHALDIQLWTAPGGQLYVFWVQNNTHRVGEGPDGLVKDGFVFDDYVHAAWFSVCENPDDDAPVFSAPRCWDSGFLRCKPLVLANGTWVLFNYDQVHDRYGYSLSYDGGKTFEHRYGAEKIATPFDECMAYQRRDGSVRMFARSGMGCLTECVSMDGAESWGQARPSGLPNADTRFYVARTPSGRVLLVNNDDEHLRKNMTLYLSEDDGETWPWRVCIDTRENISYPDVDFDGDRIYLTYDRERTGAREILFACFTEKDIMENRPIDVRVVSKP